MSLLFVPRTPTRSPTSGNLLSVAAAGSTSPGGGSGAPSGGSGGSGGSAAGTGSSTGTTSPLYVHVELCKNVRARPVISVGCCARSLTLTRCHALFHGGLTGAGDPGVRGPHAERGVDRGHLDGAAQGTDGRDGRTSDDTRSAAQHGRRAVPAPDARTMCAVVPESAGSRSRISAMPVPNLVLRSLVWFCSACWSCGCVRASARSQCGITCKSCCRAGLTGSR